MAYKDKLTEAQARELMRSGYGFELQAIAAACCAPIFWFEPPAAQDADRIRNFGTVSLVDTGSRMFGITADHVIAEYLKSPELDQSLVAQVGFAALPIHERTIARSPALDLCTIDLSEAEVERIGRRVHLSPYEWPPRPPDKNRGIFAAG